MRGATLFSGGGGVEALLKQHIEFVHAVEYDAQIAAVYRANHGDHVQVADVCNVDYRAWGALDYLHASPVCKNASQAKTDGEESDTDIQTALAVVRCLEETQPRVFTLENVQGYQRFKAYRLICRALDLAGYMWHAEVLNSADFGVPQTRRRLILRAVRDSLLPGLPPPLPWVGWYAAIEDLLDTLPPSQFAQWQKDRLPKDILDHTLFENQAPTWGDDEIIVGHRQCSQPSLTVVSTPKSTQSWRAFILHANDQRSMPIRNADEPVFTIAAASHASHAPDTKPKAWFINEDSKMGILTDDQPAPTQVSSARALRGRALLVNGDNASRELTLRNDDEPCWTGQSSTAKAPVRAWLQAGRVVKMTPRALARFQSLPDEYELPEKTGLACTIIGNSVPSLMMRDIVLPLL